jgi:hypothetical protein
MHAVWRVPDLHLPVPVRDASKLAGANAHIHLDSASNREVAQMLSVGVGMERAFIPQPRACVSDYTLRKMCACDIYTLYCLCLTVDCILVV